MFSSSAESDLRDLRPAQKITPELPKDEFFEGNMFCRLYLFSLARIIERLLRFSIESSISIWSRLCIESRLLLQRQPIEELRIFC